MDKMSFETEAISYLDEFKQSLDQIETLVLKMINEKNFKDCNHQIQRIVHSLKGTAGSFGFDLLSIVCHRVEDLLLTLEYKEIQKVVDNLLGLNDILNSICHAYKNGDTQAIQTYHEQYGIYQKKNQSSVNAFDAKNKNAMPVEFPQDKKYRALIGENSKFISSTILKSLSHFEVEISIARDGYEVFGRLLKEKFDLLLCSLHLPLIDSATLLKILELTPNSNSDIKTILLTSSKSHADRIKRENLVILEKNANLEKELKAVVTEFLPQKVVKVEESLSIPLSLLLIDDSEDIHRLVQLSLRNYPNISLSYCNDSRLAEEYIKKNNPNIILMDVQMPHIMGDALLKQLSQKKLINDSLVLFLTATDDETKVFSLRGLGAAGIIKKPFAPKLLIQNISEFIRTPKKVG